MHCAFMFFGALGCFCGQPPTPPSHIVDSVTWHRYHATVGNKQWSTRPRPSTRTDESALLRPRPRRISSNVVPLIPSNVDVVVDTAPTASSTLPAPPTGAPLPSSLHDSLVPPPGKSADARLVASMYGPGLASSGTLSPAAQAAYAGLFRGPLKPYRDEVGARSRPQSASVLSGKRRRGKRNRKAQVPAVEPYFSYYEGKQNKLLTSRNEAGFVDTLKAQERASRARSLARPATADPASCSRTRTRELRSIRAQAAAKSRRDVVVAVHPTRSWSSRRFSTHDSVLH